MGVVPYSVQKETTLSDLPNYTYKKRITYLAEENHYPKYNKIPPNPHVTNIKGTDKIANICPKKIEITIEILCSN